MSAKCDESGNVMMTPDPEACREECTDGKEWNCIPERTCENPEPASNTAVDCSCSCSADMMWDNKQRKCVNDGECICDESIDGNSWNIEPCTECKCQFGRMICNRVCKTFPFCIKKFILCLQAF